MANQRAPDPNLNVSYDSALVVTLHDSTLHVMGPDGLSIEEVKSRIECVDDGSRESIPIKAGFSTGDSGNKKNLLSSGTYEGGRFSLWCIRHAVVRDARNIGYDGVAPWVDCPCNSVSLRC